MKNNITDLFLRLVKVAAGNCKKLGVSPSQDEWQGMWQLACEQALGGWLYAAIEKLPAEERPPRPLLLEWFALTQRVKSANLKLNARAVETARYFRNNNFSSVVLKGQGVALLYPDALMRMPGDIDIWLQGGRKRISSFAKSLYPNERMTYHHVGFPMWKDVEVEVHFTPSWMYSPLSNHRLQRFFHGRDLSGFTVEASLQGADGLIRIPSVGFNLVYLMVHIYRHLFIEGIGLRQLTDYYYLLQSPAVTEAEKKNAMFMFGTLKMRRFVSAVMYVMQSVFGLENEKLLMPPNMQLGEQLLGEILAGGNFGRYDKKNASAVGESPISRFFRLQRRNLRFLFNYPSEVLWSPFFRLWQYFAVR